MASYDPDWLNRMYNNRALVPEHARHFQHWADASQAARAQLGGLLDIGYGSGPNETLDIFPAAENGSRHPGDKAPVLVFIHGGYWRSLDKSDHSFVAPLFVAGGACVVVPNYALCPAVTVPQIVAQMVAALVWTYRNIARHGGDPQRITVVGHSAGGHLAAMMMAQDWSTAGPGLPARLVRQALAVSGLYELESVMHTPFLQESLHLTSEQVQQVSPAWLPAPREGLLYTVAGALESEEFLRHGRLMQQSWGAQRVPVCEALPDLQHFSILEALADPEHHLYRMAKTLVHA